MFGLDPIVSGIIIVAIAVLAGRLGFRIDSKIEKRRKASIKAASILRSKGMTKLPDFLECYAVGDYSGMVEYIHEYATIMQDPAAVEAEFDRVVAAVQAAKAAKPA